MRDHLHLQRHGTTCVPVARQCQWGHAQRTGLGFMRPNEKEYLRQIIFGNNNTILIRLKKPN